MHTLFMICLSILLLSSMVGLCLLIKLLLDRYAVPFSPLLATGGGLMGVWILVAGIRYGVIYA